MKTMTTSTFFAKVASALLIAVLVVSTAPLAASASTKTKPSIKLDAPTPKSVFAKEGSGIIPISWSATNVPDSTLIILELEQKKLAKDSSIGGGSWQSVITPGDSVGSHNWDIEGEGRAGAGTYRVRALLQECVQGDCNKNPFFPGMRKTKTYAKSKWVKLTIVRDADRESEEASRTIGTRAAGPVSVTVVPADGSGDTVTVDVGSTPTFNYYPGGDVQSCAITAYYEGGKRTETHGWKNAIKAGDYGRSSFAAVGPYPLMALQSVEVVCGNSVYRASDTVRVTVANAAEVAEYKILIGKSGSSTYKKGTASKAEAQAYCSRAYNDDRIHKYTRVQCYWGGERFEDVSEFKG